MDAMATLYLVCLCVGTVGFIATLARKRTLPVEIPIADPGRRGGGLTVPGARIEPSDQFAVEGGAGGAEGEGGSPGYEDGADGGIGGAEGGADGILKKQPALAAAAFAGAFLAGFGGAGYVVSSSADASVLKGIVLGLIGGAVLGALGLSASGFVEGRRDAGL